MLSTKNIPSGSGMSKSILPGAKVLKINSITLDKVSYKEDAYHLTLHTETEPVEGLDGFFIDKDDASKGKYLGQIGRIKAGSFPFSDGTTKSGIKIERDRTILQFVKNVATELGFYDWFEAQDNKFSSIEEFVLFLDSAKPFKNIYFNAVVSGKEYEKNGYINYDLFFPKFDKTSKPMEAIKLVDTANQGALIKFDNEVHIKKLSKAPTSAPVDLFEGSLPVSNSVGNDFEL